MKKLPIGIQNFEKIIKEGYLYVDKTEYIYKLITAGAVYFLSRPRRFGKSLLISTLENIYKGNKELFKGLYIYDKINWEEIKRPVIRIDMVNINKETPEMFRESLLKEVKKIGEEYNIEIKSNNYHSGFRELIETLGKEKRVTLLIDEYDKPIIDFIENPEIAAANREILKNFYGIIKGTDEYLTFVLLTGVSKFSRTSIFSDLNNLNDITMHNAYAKLLGYTEKELPEYFSGYIDELSRVQGISPVETQEKIKKWYNGYRFSSKPQKVYNPFSVLNLFDHKEYKNYWFETGTPTFLVKLIKRKNYNLSRLENLVLSESGFSKYKIEDISIEALLFQTGYLTIEKAEGEGIEREYKLYYPNLEVKVSLINCLYNEYAGNANGEASIIGKKLKRKLKAGDIDDFIEGLKPIFSGIPYEIFVNKEDYYNSIIYTILSLSSIDAKFEMMTNIGRLDCVIEYEDKVYIFEFKLDTSAEKALEQIKEKRYYEKYEGRNKKIYLIGIEFNSKERNISGYKIETK